jgi:ubiquinone biosynthesis protein
MSSLLRFFTIIRVILRYRLDTLLHDEQWPFTIRMLLAILNQLLPSPALPRGERVRLALEDLGPIFIKFGQLLSTRPDLIPSDICGELSRLQDNVPPFDSGEFVNLVETALNDSIDNLFQSFDRTPLASASVAQVHSAILADGRAVVVKAIRPGIRNLILEDTRLLLKIAGWIERASPLGRRLHPVDVVRDYRNIVLDELNLRREAANTSTLRRNFQNSPMLYVPEVHWPLTTENVMVTERIYAIPVTDMETLRARNTNFKALAERGVEIFFTQVFDHNFFHADMHPGNIFVDATDPEKPKYLAVDCAVIGSLSDEDRYYLARNLLAIFRRDYRQVAELHVISGWVPEQTSIAEFEAAIRTVCEPIFERPICEISFAQTLVSLFRTAQRFEMEIQPSLVLLEKTLINIEGLGRQLYPQLDLWSTAFPFLEKWLKSRMSPDNLVGQLKRYGPEWIEQFPHMPHLLYQSIEQIRTLDKSVKAIGQSSDSGRFRKRTGIVLLTVAATLALADASSVLTTLSGTSLILAGAGVMFLLFR